jgi:PPOX class probable F420-dependent enzyme
MSGVVLSADARRLLDGRNVAHLATLMPDGAPKVEPVWVGREDDLVLVTTDVKSIKAKNLANDPRMALSVTDASNPYLQLLIRGQLIEARPDDNLETMDGLALKYLGQAFPRRRWSGRVVLVMQPTLARYYESSLANLVVEPDG